MRNDGMNFNFEIDPQFQAQNLQKLREARKRAVEAMGMVWADETKQLTRDEEHVDTSLYINSIGYVTNIPATGKSGKGERNATEADVIHELEELQDKTRLTIGSNVDYAEDLEKRFHLMARGLDIAKPRMKMVADVQVALVFNP